MLKSPDAPRGIGQMNETSVRKAPAGRKKAIGRRKRDSALTKDSILQAATIEFCRNGLGGARVEAIAQRAKANMRLLYHYFGDKDGLFLAVLEHVYSEIRAAEQQLHLDDLDPVEAMAQLVDFTFTFFQNHEDYVALINNENLQRGKHLRKSRTVSRLTLPLVASIESILRRGIADGVMRGGVDPIHLYVSITALSYFHVSNRYTLSALFDEDLGDAKWLHKRRKLAQDVIVTWLTDPKVVRNEAVRRSAPKRVASRGRAVSMG